MILRDSRLQGRQLAAQIDIAGHGRQTRSELRLQLRIRPEHASLDIAALEIVREEQLVLFDGSFHEQQCPRLCLLQPEQGEGALEQEIDLYRQRPGVRPLEHARKVLVMEAACIEHHRIDVVPLLQRGAQRFQQRALATTGVPGDRRDVHGRSGSEVGGDQVTGRLRM